MNVSERFPESQRVSGCSPTVTVPEAAPTGCLVPDSISSAQLLLLAADGLVYPADPLSAAGQSAPIASCLVITGLLLQYLKIRMDTSHVASVSPCNREHREALRCVGEAYGV